MNLLYRRNIMYPQQFYFWWLTKAAVQNIIAAFGEPDGVAVIKATNAYLNQLAASDRDKATALAGFINAYPVNWGTYLITYQPVEYLEGNGNQYITNVISYSVGDYPTIEIKMLGFTKQTEYGNCAVGIYKNTSAGVNQMTISSDRLTISTYIMRMGTVNDRINVVVENASTTNPHILILNSPSGSYFDDNLESSEYRATNVNFTNVPIFTRKPGTAEVNLETFVGRIYYVRFDRTGNTERYMFPCFRKSDNVRGMWDLINGTFYVNNGSGTFGKGANVIINTPSTP